MSRRTAPSIKSYFIMSVLLISMIGGFILSSNNFTSQPAGGGGAANGEPLAHLAPSFNTPKYVFIDNFSSPLNSSWYTNPNALARGATFSTITKPGYLTLYTPSTNSFQQTSALTANNGAYANVTLPRNLDSQSATFTIETKVDYTKTGSSNSYQLGLIVDFPAQRNMLIWGPYQSDKSIGLTYQGSLQSPKYPLSSAPSAYYLRIVKNGTSYYCYHSTDGDSWILDRTYTQSASPKFVGLIVRTYGSSPYPEITANFDYFRVSVDAAIDEVIPSLTTLGTGWPTTIQAHMKYYYNTTDIGSGYVGLLANGTQCQVQETDSNGWATFSVAFYTVGLRICTLYAINNSQYNLNPLSNFTSLEITWTGYTITVGATDHEGQPVSGATARLQFTGNHTFVKAPQTTNATGYCSFSSVPWGDTGVYSLNVFERLYNSTHTSYYNTTVPLGRVDHDLLQPVTLNTTILTVYVEDSNLIPFQGTIIKVYNGTGSHELIATQAADLTARGLALAWANLTLPVLPLTKPLNLTVWYQGSQLYISVNQTGLYQHGYSFYSTNKWYFNVTASMATNKFPTQLSWRYNPIVVAYWGQSFNFSVWLVSSGTKIDASPVNCTFGSFMANLDKNGSVTGNYKITIPAALIGKVPFGSTSATFTLTINAYPLDPYLIPVPLTIQVIIKAVNLTATYSNSLSTNWNSNVSLWVQLSHLNGTKFNRGALSVNLDGNPSSFPFSPVMNGFYNLTSSSAFGLPVGDHTFQLALSMDNYTLVGVPGQIISIRLSIQPILTSPIVLTQSYFNETQQPQSSHSVLYWNWTVVYNISYINQVNGMPIRNASVYVAFSRGGQEILGSIASYNSTTSTYVAEFDTLNFGNAGSYVCTITASEAGYSTKYFSDVLTISWRPMSLTFSSQNYNSLKGLFGGDSSAHVEVTLKDQLSGFPLSGADLSYTWEYGSGNFTYIVGGIYATDVHADANVPVNVYVMTINATTPDYTGQVATVNMNVDFQGGHGWLPLVGIVPMSMFIIVLGAVVAVGSVGGIRAYIYATTPYIIKQINNALQAINKEEQAEPIEGLRTRIETPFSLLLPELEALGISLEKEEAARKKEVKKKEKKQAKLNKKAKQKVKAALKAEPKTVVTEEVSPKGVSQEVKPEPKAMEEVKPETQITEEAKPELETKTKQEQLEPSETRTEKGPSPPAEVKEKLDNNVDESNGEVSEQEAGTSKGPSEEEKRDEGGN